MSSLVLLQQNCLKHPNKKDYRKVYRSKQPVVVATKVGIIKHSSFALVIVPTFIFASFIGDVIFKT